MHIYSIYIYIYIYYCLYTYVCLCYIYIYVFHNIISECRYMKMCSEMTPNTLFSKSMARCPKNVKVENDPCRLLPVIFFYVKRFSKMGVHIHIYKHKSRADEQLLCIQA